MAVLVFPENPADGQLYPNPCPEGVTQYKWEASTGIWRIVGVATAVVPGIYGDDHTIPRIVVDVRGIISDAFNVPIRSASVGVSGIVPLNDTTTSISVIEALTARAGKYLQDQIGNLTACIIPPENRPNVVSALNFLQNEVNRLEAGSTMWCGYYNAAEGNISFVSILGAEFGYEPGENLPPASPRNSGDFFIVNRAGNPYLAGDFNAPNVDCKVGDWIISEAVKWTRVDTGNSVSARDVSFDPRNTVYTATNVQGALQQTSSLLRSGGIGGALVSPTKPTTPYQGQLWWDSDDGYFYVYYNDGNGSQWVEIGGGGSESITSSSGTVYEVRTGAGLTGGPITTEGTISLVAAQSAALGGVAVPSNRGLNLSGSGVLTLSPATNNLLGGIIVGDNLKITADGVLSAEASVSPSADSVPIRPIQGISTANTVQEGLEAIELQAQDRVETVRVIGAGLQASVSNPVYTSNQGTELLLTTIPASTLDTGVVRLTSDLGGVSESLALTQKAGNVLQNQIAALVGVNILAGTYDARLGQMTYVTPAGAARGFVVGQNCPPASPLIDNYYVIITVGGNQGPPGAPPKSSQPNDWYICQADVGPSVWFLIDYENVVIAASTVEFTPFGTITATNVQQAIEQVQTNADTGIQTITSSVGIDVTTSAPGLQVSSSGRTVNLSLQAASQYNLGGVYVVPNRGLLLGSDGGLSLLPPSTDGTQVGGVKAGANITISPDGTISGTGSGASDASQLSLARAIPGIEFATNVQQALEALELQTQDRVEFIDAVTEGLSVTISAPGPSYDGTRAQLSLAIASPSVRGGVQLTNDITGGSEILAPTQLAVSALNSKVDALTGANVLAGTYDCSAGVVLTLTPAGRKAGFIVGQNCPPAANVPDNYYVIITVGGGFGPPGAVVPPTGLQPGDWFICENQPAIAAPNWNAIDYDQRTTSASLVSLSPGTGFSATNVQTAFGEVYSDLQNTFINLIAANNGITVSSAPGNGPGKVGTLRLNPGTSTDIGGVYVPPGNGLNLDGNGALTLAVASSGGLGGIKVGRNLSIAPDGTLNAADAPVSSIRFISLYNIAGGFNGVTVDFPISSPEGAIPASTTAAMLFLEVGGVLQPPNDGYSFNPGNNVVTFTSPPPAGASFSGRALVTVVADSNENVFTSDGAYRLLTQKYRYFSETNSVGECNFAFDLPFAAANLISAEAFSEQPDGSASPMQLVSCSDTLVRFIGGQPDAKVRIFMTFSSDLDSW